LATVWLVGDDRPADLFRSHLRRDLANAMKARHRDVVAALRTLIAAIDNAESNGIAPPSTSGSSAAHIAGATTGPGSTEADRRLIGPDELQAILQTEIRELEEQVGSYEKLGKSAEADSLKIQLRVMSRYRDLS
jgi:uncharacterized protein